MFPCLLQTLALQCENYQGEKLLCCQLSLDQLAKLQDGWLSVSLQLLGRRSSPDGETPEGQRAAEELGRVLSEFLKHLGTQVAGETGERLQLLLVFPVGIQATATTTATLRGCHSLAFWQHHIINSCTLFLIF